MEAKPVLAKVEYEGKTTLALVTRVPIHVPATLARIARNTQRKENDR